jgi:hypothetical protein
MRFFYARNIAFFDDLFEVKKLDMKKNWPVNYYSTKFVEYLKMQKTNNIQVTLNIHYMCCCCMCCPMSI